MRLRFKTVLAIIFILIITCASVGVGYLFYTNVSNEPDIVVDGKLTINYLNGKKFKFKSNGELELSVTNNDTEQNYYYIEFMDVDANNVTYTLSSSSNIEVTNELKNGVFLEHLLINTSETVKFKINFKSEVSEWYSGSIHIGVKENEENNFSDVILANNSVGNKPLSNFGEKAVLDEGLLTAQDDYGIAYYFRGNILNNNVSFAGEKWKIVKINGDGSVKLVLTNSTSHVSKYSDDKKDFKESDIYEALMDWYNNHLNDYSDYIAPHRFCNDYVLEDDKNYIAYTRLITNRIPTYMCLGEFANAKIGLLTADEVVLAGGTNGSNTKYYLYNNDIETAYYTMTFAKQTGDTSYPFLVNPYGSLIFDVSSNLLRGIRPVINITKNVKATGTGTEKDPYVLSLS